MRERFTRERDSADRLIRLKELLHPLFEALGYAPMGAETYLKGNSLEHLNDLEHVRLTTEEAQEGFYIHDTQKILFRMIYEGLPARSGPQHELDFHPSPNVPWDQPGRAAFRPPSALKGRPTVRSFTPLAATFFVPASDIGAYTPEETLFDGEPRRFPKVTFIYRLAGRDREKSASYYIPAVLTGCLVK